MDEPDRSRPLLQGIDDDSKETNEYALYSVFFGLIWLFGIGAFAAIYFARKALRQIEESDGREGGVVIAKTGMAIGIFGLGSFALLVAFVISGARA